MNICYFGDYNPEYPRHIVLIDGLKSAGVTVHESRLQKTGLAKYFEIIQKARAIPKETDVVLVAYSNSRFVWFLRLFTRRPIFWNAFYSKYNCWVEDRKRVHAGSPKALFLWIQDFLCCHASNQIILETNADIAYFKKTFKVKDQKFIRILVGYNEYLIHPQPPRTTETDTFVVEFHGWYIPLQGVPVIVKAAKQLEEYPDITFNIVGNGQTYQEVQELAKSLNVKNVNFLPPVPHKELLGYMRDADVCIGLVGDVSRVNQAIPNKVFEASGTKRASINADTDAIRELFTDRENIVLIKRGDSEDLAEKILMLRNDPQLKNRIAENAYTTIREHASIKVLGANLREGVSEYLTKRL